MSFLQQKFLIVCIENIYEDNSPTQILIPQGPAKVCLFCKTFLITQSGNGFFSDYLYFTLCIIATYSMRLFYLSYCCLKSGNQLNNS